MIQCHFYLIKVQINYYFFNFTKLFVFQKILYLILYSLFILQIFNNLIYLIFFFFLFMKYQLNLKFSQVFQFVLCFYFQVNFHFNSFILNHCNLLFLSVFSIFNFPIRYFFFMVNQIYSQKNYTIFNFQKLLFQFLNYYS